MAMLIAEADPDTKNAAAVNKQAYLTKSASFDDFVNADRPKKTCLPMSGTDLDPPLLTLKNLDYRLYVDLKS